MRGPGLRLLSCLTVLVPAALVPPAGAAGAGPRLEAFSYFGGERYDRAQGCAVDRDGSVLIVGNTRSRDLPTTPGALDRSFGGHGEADGFVARLSPDLTRVVAATYLGGSGQDRAYGVDVDEQGFVTVSGITKSDDFPTTPGAFQREKAGDTDVFVARLTPDLSRIVFATLLGGDARGVQDSDWNRGGLQRDAAGNILIVGKTGSRTFPTTPGAFQRKHAGGRHDAFVTKLSADGSRLLWSTLVGGSHNESFYGNLAVHRDGSVTAAGFSNSADFPTTPGAFGETFSGERYRWYAGDGAVVRLSPDGSRLVYGTYLWGSVSGNDGIALDDQERLWSYGSVTARNAGLVPVAPGVFQERYGGGKRDAVIARISQDGSRVETASFLGGDGFEEASGIGVGKDGTLFLSGNTNAPDFPVTPGARQPTYGGGENDAWLTVLTPALTALYSTYLGGPGLDRGRCIAVGADGRVILTGDSEGGIPGVPAGFSNAVAGDRDGFAAVFRMPDPQAPPADGARGP